MGWPAGRAVRLREVPTEPGAVSATSPSRSCALASAIRPTPSSRAVALVTGPIETPRTPERSWPASASAKRVDGGRRRERDGVGREHALGVARPRGERAVERHDVDLGAGRSQALGQRVARLLRRARRARARRPGRPAAPPAAPRPRSARPRRRRRSRPRAAPRRCPARSPRPSRRRARARRRRSARAAAAGRWARSRRRARTRAASIGGPSSGSMRMTAHSSTSAPRSRSRSTRPLAWARARVTTTRRPCSGRSSAQASCSRSAATAPITVTAGERMPAASTSAAIVASVPVDAALRGGRPRLGHAHGRLGRLAAGDQRGGDRGRGAPRP